MLRKLSPKGEKGQSLIEMAITLPILLLLMSGLLDFGRIYFTYVALEDAAREGALYLALYPQRTDSSVCADPKNLIYRIENASRGAANIEVDWSLATIDYEVAFAQVGEAVFVTIEYPFSLITPVISNIFGNTLTLTVDASQIIISKSADTDSNPCTDA